MIGIKFEVLSLMTTMHAVGLMPDDIYQREKERLVGDVIAYGSRTKALNLADWERHPDTEKWPILHEDDMSDRMPFDWRAVIANFLESAHMSADWLRWANSGDIATEAKKLGVDNEYRDYLTASSVGISELGLINRSICDLEYDTKSEISGLRQEIQQLRSELSSRIHDVRLDMRAPVSVSSKAKNADEIESLQRQMAQCLSFAAQHEAKGESYAAGQLKGQAAKLESKLRALGA